MDEVTRRRWEKSLHALRQDADEAALVWRRAGGHRPVGGPPVQPELYAHVREAFDRYYVAATECYPADLEQLLHSAREGDRAAVEDAISWLEADYFTRRTGYIKQRIMHHLCQATLTDVDKERLRSVVLSVCTRGQRQEFREVKRLARRQLASPSFAAQLLELAESTDTERTRAAALMIRAAVESGK